MRKNAPCPNASAPPPPPAYPGSTASRPNSGPAWSPRKIVGLIVAVVCLAGLCAVAAPRGQTKQRAGAKNAATQDQATEDQDAGPKMQKQAGAAANAFGPSDADKKSIRTWLRENLGEPRWDEIKWYPSVPIKEIARRQLQHVSGDYAIEVNQDRLKGDDYRVCQVKLRAKWVLGISSVKTKVFRIWNGKADLYGYMEEYYEFVPPEDRGSVADHL